MKMLVHPVLCCLYLRRNVVCRVPLGIQRGKYMVNDDRHAIVYIGIEWQHLHDLLKVLLQAILLAEQRTVVLPQKIAVRL